MSAKDKLAYFKDNIAGADEDDFDASQYYYNRSGTGPPDENAPNIGELGYGGGPPGSFVGTMPGGSGGIFGGSGMPSQLSSQPMNQRSVSATGGAPGIPPAPGLNGASSSSSSQIGSIGGGDQYGTGSNSLGNMSQLNRSTSAPSPYNNQDPQNQQQTPGDLFALLNKSGNSGGGAGGPGGSQGAVGGSKIPNNSSTSNVAPGGGSGSGGTTSMMGSAEVAGLSMMPGQVVGNGVDSLSMPPGVHPGGDPSSFDISEFPALGGAPGTGRVMGGGQGGGGGGNFGAYPDSSQHSAEFTSMMSEESFPALPGGLGQDGSTGLGLGGLGLSTSGSGNSITSGAGSGGGGENSDGTVEGKQAQYGLLGLLAVIRMMDADLNTLALGSDLTTLGLNLNSSRCLYSTFSSPWADGPSNSDPQFTLPSCYFMATPPPLKHAHLHKFQLETLFYIFYAMPKDLLQAYSGQELYQREWRYHAELKLWFRRATQQDLPHLPADRAATQYIFFDINSWECRLFSGVAHVVSSGLLSEEDIRVRIP
mmetsp:Transcript_61/g.69  ORF Transcript_61/g.69 Transcript_61/m.69 type:complete len:534 (-) Transcript_61:215-1816(-)